MSRIVFRSLPRLSIRPPTALISHHRHRSNKSRRAQLIEADVDQASSSQEEVITLGIRKFEDAIHSIIVRRSAPDWLPFLPGYSFWVPPRTSPMRPHHSAGNMIDIIGRLASSGVARDRGSSRLDLLSEDENLAFTSSKGWPSSSFYIQGTSLEHPIPVMEIEVKIQDDEGQNQADNASSSEDEEG